MLKVYLAAISACHVWIDGEPPGSHFLAVQFLKGARRLWPPRTPSLPAWHLDVVLDALSQAPFEPLNSADLKLVSLTITSAKHVCLALRYFASEHFIYSIGDAEHLSKNTVCHAVCKVVLALTKQLDAFVVFPGHKRGQKIKESFYALIFLRAIKRGFFSVIDCMHIPIRVPLGEHEGDYVNRKSFHSISVQMTCDHHLTVTSLKARWPGSVHDSRIFQESTLGQRFEQGCFDGLLLGDRDYPCLRYLMTHYPDPQTREQMKHKGQDRDDIWGHQSTLLLACKAYGCVWSGGACEVVAACVVLHNMATIRKERSPCQLPMPPDVMNPVMWDHPTGRAVREATTNNFFHQ
ncbi:HARB1 nuclease, partial [Amia calva]|nr:HARB1 nuclease [Amia calva]